MNTRRVACQFRILRSLLRLLYSENTQNFMSFMDNFMSFKMESKHDIKMFVFSLLTVVSRPLSSRALNCAFVTEQGKDRVFSLVESLRPPSQLSRFFTPKKKERKKSSRKSARRAKTDFHNFIVRQLFFHPRALHCFFRFSFPSFLHLIRQSDSFHVIFDYSPQEFTTLCCQVLSLHAGK